MRYKVTFATGFAAGYLLGARAGRERYEQIMRALRGFAESPTVQEAAGVLQQQAGELVDTARRTVSEQFGADPTPQPVGTMTAGPPNGRA